MRLSRMIVELALARLAAAEAVRGIGEPVFVQAAGHRQRRGDRERRRRPGRHAQPVRQRIDHRADHADDDAGERKRPGRLRRARRRRSASRAAAAAASENSTLVCSSRTRSASHGAQSSHAPDAIVASSSVQARSRWPCRREFANALSLWMKAARRVSVRHPEVRRGGEPRRATARCSTVILRGSLRSHLRMTD